MLDPDELPRIKLDELMHILTYHGPDSRAVRDYWRARALTAEKFAKLRLITAVAIFGLGLGLGWLL